MLDFGALDKKWQTKWAAAKLFDADPDKRRKFFTSNVIPYVNGNVHIGHSYTFTRTDVYARFKRMQGFNTLLEETIRRNPEHYFWMHRRWKTRPPDETPDKRIYP